MSRNSYIRESGFVVRDLAVQTRTVHAAKKAKVHTGAELLESWLGRRAHGVKPATDVHFGVSFTAVMPGSRRVRRFKIPSMHSQLGISTSNHEPVAGITGHESTDFTSEFLQRCHAFSSVYQWFANLVADLVSELWRMDHAGKPLSYRQRCNKLAN